MKKILNVTSSALGENSKTIKLQQEIIAKLQAQYPGSTVVERNVAEQAYPHLEEEHLGAFYAPAGTEAAAAARNSDEAIQEVFDADIIVIGAPMYNFSIPSSLKAWVDHIIRRGKTFAYNAQGVPEGQVHGKKVYLAIATGGVYSEGFMKQYDFVEPYLRSVLGFIGLTDITAFRIEGTSVPGVQDTAVQKGLESVTV